MTTQIKSVDFDSVDSKFPPSTAQYGKMHMVEFGTGSDGIKRTCAKVVAKKGFQWTEHMTTDQKKAKIGHSEENSLKGRLILLASLFPLFASGQTRRRILGRTQT